MARLQLPDFFKERLADSPQDGVVQLALDRCSAFLDDPTRKLPFFPEFTDHSINHVQCVLDAASELLTPEAKKILTQEDVAVLVCAILLHDSAMHLTQEGFLQLIKPDIRRPIIPAIDSLDWATQWSAFLSEASRWDGRKLRTVLGDTGSDPKKELTELVDFIRSPDEMGSPDR